jgi:transposase InsO family protein
VFQDLCDEYGISPKTGYKWKKRFEEEGVSGLHDQSRRPRRHPKQLTETEVCEIVRIKLAHARWGPRKIREVYRRTHGAAPSESSFKRVLDRAGLVEKRRKRKRRDPAQRLTRRVPATAPNEVWTVDFKGWWHFGGQQRCEPLTIRDEYSRYLLAIRAMNTSRTEPVRAEFEQVFEHFGLPKVIRSDNGPPFASVGAPLGLSRLSVWWVMLGIDLDRIAPGHPEQNGGHERMHRDIRTELQGMIEGDLSDHQAAFDVWRREFNEERPHEAIAMKTPAELYCRSDLLYDGALTSVDYPRDMIIRKVTCNGRLCLKKQVIFLSQALIGCHVALRAICSERWEVWLDHLRLGEIDLKTATMDWADQPSPSS